MGDLYTIMGEIEMCGAKLIVRSGISGDLLDWVIVGVRDSTKQRKLEFKRAQTGFLGRKK
jgi:hypothetical protein